MVYIVSAKIPPEYSGAGKRIKDFYEFLRKREVPVRILTYTSSNEEDGVFRLNKKHYGIGKAGYFFELIFSFAQILYLFYRGHKTNEKHAVWLVSTSPLTFAATFAARVFKYRIITQNTLIGSDDPEFRYNGDFLGIKYKLKILQYRLSDSVTSISPALFEITKKYHPNCCMIPNPVSAKFKPNKKEDRKDIFKVLFVGALTYRKGLDIVFKTIDIVHKSNPEIIFNLVGSETGYSDDLRELYKDLSNINRENVFFAGMQQDVLPWFKDSDILFFPSRREGFGLVYIEAMASGIPVVAKQMNGITDYIFGGQYNTILDSDDPALFAEKIFLLENNKDEYRRLSILGTQLVKRFDEIKIFEEYLKVIDGLC